MGSKQKFKSVPKHKKLKGKRWKKGQSSSSNPEIKRYREAAKNRFFNPQSGSSGLTVDALAKHDEKQQDGDVTIYDKDSDVQSAAGKTFNTWATNWTECTNATFGKVHRYWASNSAQHKEILAVLAAVTEVIKSQGGTETETEYFAALMTVLETTDSVESLTAIAYLLNLVIKRVPAAVLQSRFAEISRLILDTLATHADQEATSLLKSLLLSLAVVLRVQEKAVWSNTSTQRIFQGFLTFITHKKPKVRKAAHHGILIVLKGSLFITQGESPQHHPAAAMTAKFCTQKIEEFGGTGEALDTLHTLALLKDILSCLPLNSVKSTCETILRVMTLSNVMVTSCGMQALHGLFSSKPPSTTLSAELNAQIISALYEYQPADNDVQPMNAWFAVMEKAHINLALLDGKLSVNHLPRLFSVAMTCLMSDKTEVATAATKTMKILLKECLAPSVDSFKSALETSGDAVTPVHKLVKAAEAGLSYQFFASWGLVMQLFAVLFEVTGKDFPQLLKKCLQSIVDLRDSPKFPYKPELDHAIGCAIKYMGPRHVIEAVPLKITGDNDDYTFPRSWLLPVLRDNVCNTELGFFVSYFLPLAAKLRQRSSEALQTSNQVVSKSYEVLQSQIWSLLPGFCANPTDLLQSFKGIAKILGSAINERADLRIEVMSSLRKLINKSLEDEATKKEVGRFAKNFLPILLNLFTTEPENAEDRTRLAVLQTTKVYLMVADSKLVATFCDRCLEKLKAEDVAPFKRNALLDLSTVMLPYVDADRVCQIYQCAKSNLQRMDKSAQKKSYRVLEEICGQTSEGCQDFVQKNLDDIQKVLLESLSTSSPSSKAPRLRCLTNIFKLLQQEQKNFMIAVIPEAILCTREVAEKARSAAYGLLVEMCRAHTRWSGSSSEAEALRSYFKLVMAGLAGSPQMVSCTLLALTRVLYEFKAHVDGLLLEVIVDNVCLLLTAKAREIVKSTVGFVKVLLSVYQDTTLAPHLKTLMSSLVSMKEDCHHHFRFKTKEIFSKLIKKFGYETIFNMSPASIHKVLVNIRKTQERAKKKRKEKENEDGDQSDEEHFKSQPESVADLLQDTDSEMEDDDKKGKKKSNKSQKSSKSGQAWLHEGDENAFVDFLDPTASKKILATKPVKTEPAKPRETGFKTAPDGRLIIHDGNDKDDKGSEMEDEDDLDELLEAIEKGSGATKRAKKRKVEDLGSDDEESAPKYKAGGTGIHRPIAKATRGKDQTAEMGSEYKARKAGGDVKKKGKPDPYTYVPLNFQALNRRKKKKLEGRFNNLVKGAKKGAMKGTKGKKRNG